jgi:hypothetical protein
MKDHNPQKRKRETPGKDNKDTLSKSTLKHYTSPVLRKHESYKQITKFGPPVPS